MIMYCRSYAVPTDERVKAASVGKAELKASAEQVRRSSLVSATSAAVLVTRVCTNGKPLRQCRFDPPSFQGKERRPSTLLSNTSHHSSPLIILQSPTASSHHSAILLSHTASAAASYICSKFHRLLSRHPFTDQPLRQTPTKSCPAQTLRSAVASDLV
jgi:hypothetical protein